MLKSCQYCGKIHDSKFDCGKKPQKRYNRTKKNKFRSTAVWQHKTVEIRERDNYLCVACFNNLNGTIRKLNHDDLSVHHIEPLEERYDLRFDNDNLITLCRNHHEMAENGAISKADLKKIIPPTSSFSIY